MGTNTSALARLRQAGVVVLHTLTGLGSGLIGLTSELTDCRGFIAPVRVE
jgi:hypothetical protein